MYSSSPQQTRRKNCEESKSLFFDHFIPPAEDDLEILKFFGEMRFFAFSLVESDSNSNYQYVYKLNGNEGNSDRKKFTKESKALLKITHRRRFVWCNVLKDREKEQNSFSISFLSVCFTSKDQTARQ